MSFVDNYQLRVSIVSWLLANSIVTDTLDDVLEIREMDWFGEKFSYPNIRVTCATTPTECSITDATVTLSCFSEQKSSKQAIQSQGIVAKQLHNVNFTSEGIKISAIQVTSLPDAEQVSESVWKADIMLSMKVNEVT